MHSPSLSLSTAEHEHSAPTYAAPREATDAHVAGSLIAGKYRLEKKLGFGGMGTVWLARNVTLNSPVALKLIRPELRGSESVQRLLTEACVEANLNHPGIVRVFDFGQTQGGDAFIVMEPLEGRSLGDVLLEQGRLNSQVAVQLILPVIDALCCAHQHGVIHRDLKPDNIFITTTDPQRLHPKLLDFGIAKLSEARRASYCELTPSGVVMGSAAYMAPEQARGELDVDVRVDVWALCAVLYEAIAGRSAFEGDNYNALLCSVIVDVVEPLVDEGGGEAELWHILARGLAKDRDERIGSMRELGEALARWLVARGIVEDICGQAIERTWGILTPAHPARATMESTTGLSPTSPISAVRARPRRERRVVQFHCVERTEMPQSARAGAPTRIS